MRTWLTKIFPILSSVTSYKYPLFIKDLFAGLTVGVVLVPQGMAYAMLAGVPPIYGLYAGLVPLLLYALLGTSRMLSIGPVAVSALLVLAGISQIAQPFTEEYIGFVILTGLCIGVIQILAGILRLGFMVNFLSHPVIAGFSSAAAIIIIISQFKDVLGFSIEGSTSAESLYYAFNNLTDTHWPTLGVCLGSLLLLIVLKRINRKIPGALIITIVATAVTAIFHLNDAGLSIIGDIPQGLPALLIPAISMENIRLVIPTVLTVAIIGTVECIGIAKVMESKTKDHVVVPNRELIALGISKLIGSVFQAIPTSGSFTRSAVNNESGAYSQISSIITVVLIGSTLLFLTPLFYYLPKAVLAAIILYSVVGLFEFGEAKKLWKIHKSDFWMMMATFLITLGIGIEEGVFCGVVLSIATVLYQSTIPHVAILGNIPKTPFYRNINRYEASTTSEQLLILRFDDQLYFGNASFFKEFIRTETEERSDSLTHLLLDCSNIHNMDSSGAHALEETEDYLAVQGIELHLAGARGPLRDMLFKSGMMTEPHKHHMNVHDGVLSITGVNDAKAKIKATQKNT